MRGRPAFVQLALRPRGGESYPSMNDGGGTLLEPLSADDRQLFARAYDEHRAALLGFVRKRVSTDTEAADLVQEAYSRLLRYRKGQNLESLKSLLFQIAINLLTDRARLVRSEHISLQDDFPLEAENPSGYRQVAGEQDLMRLKSAIAVLPRRCREVFVLRRFHGMNHQQIADRLGITLKAVERHITNAVHLCRKRMEGRRT